MRPRDPGTDPERPPPAPPPGGQTLEAEPEPYAGRFAELPAGGLRARTARGTIVNSAFFAGLDTLALAKAIVVAALLTRAEYGIWGILVILVSSFMLLKQAGVGEKYVQQAEDDQRLAFQRAFTLEMVWSAVLLGLIVAALPLLALAYGRSELIVPGLVLATVVPAIALQSPAWVYYRRMQFARQRALLSVDPAVTFAVTVALAASGLGYWALVIGFVAGSWTGAAAAVAFSPYPLALRYERGAARRYLAFSWPLLAANVSLLAVAQLSMLLGETELGLAGASAIALGAAIATYTDRVDVVVTQTLYPAICAVRDRTELLFETFVKSNRLTLMWGVPFGVAIALFVPDLVSYVIGEKWRSAVVLLQVWGLVSAANHIGFNWTAFFAARAETRPIAVVGVLTLGGFLAAAVPLLFLYGLPGFAGGIAAMTAVSLVARTWFLTRLFPAFQMLLHALRALAPTVPAAGAVLLARALEAGERTAATAAGELALYAAVTAAATLALERPLLREVAGYLLKQPRPAR